MLRIRVLHNSMILSTLSISPHGFAFLNLWSATVLGTASTSSVRFCARRRRTGKSSELVVSAKRRECLAGGFNDRVDEIRFSFTPTPKEFFVGASESAKFVWFFGSTDWPTTVICFTTQWTNLLACYPISASSFLLHSFALKKISWTKMMMNSSLHTIFLFQFYTFMLGRSWIKVN